MKRGSTLVAPSFLAVGGTAASINDLTPSNIGDYINGEINFQSLDAYGRMIEGSAFIYLGYEGMTGWYDGEFSPASTSLTPGEGVWFESPEGVKLTFYAPDL